MVFLAPDGPLPAEPAPHLGAGLLAVQLLDDLCGTVRVGDRALVTGVGRYWGGGGAAAAAGAALPLTLGVQVGAAGMRGQEAGPGRDAVMLGMNSTQHLCMRGSTQLQRYTPPAPPTNPTGSTQMEACNVQLLRPTQLSSADELSPGTRRQLAALSGGGLEALLGTLDAAVPEAAAACPLLKLALLLSAAAAGTGRAEVEAEPEDDPDPQTVLRRRVAASRHQVRAAAVGGRAKFF